MPIYKSVKGYNVKCHVQLLMELHLTATGCQLPDVTTSTWCYLPLDISEHTPP